MRKGSIREGPGLIYESKLNPKGSLGVDQEPASPTHKPPLWIFGTPSQSTSQLQDKLTIH